MELSIREWLVIVGAVIVFGIALDAYRRIRRDKREQEEFKNAMSGLPPKGSDFNPELPNGGARVIRPAKEMAAMPSSPYQGNLKNIPKTVQRAKPKEVVETSSFLEAQMSEEIDRLTADTQSKVQGSDVGNVETPEPALSSQDDRSVVRPSIDDDWGNYREGTSMEVRDEPEDAGFTPEQEGRLEKAVPETESFGDPNLDHEAVQDVKQSGRVGHEAVTEIKVDAGLESSFSGRMKKGIESFARRFKVSEDQTSGQPAMKTGQKEPKNRELIVIHVESKDRGGFSGKDLLALFEACGLVHGEYKIFHRHEEADTSSPVQFSVSNSFEPGYFDLQNLEQLATPGVSFFLSLPGPSNNMMAFDYMVETARCVVRNLHGELKDENHSAVTAQTLEHCRQRIREFERKQKLAVVH